MLPSYGYSVNDGVSLLEQLSLSSLTATEFRGAVRWWDGN